MINTADLSGHIVEMKTLSDRHYTNVGTTPRPKDDVSGSFGDLLNQALGRTNNLQVDAESKLQQMIYEPESIEIHTVMLAMQKADVALNFTKSVRDEAIKAYRNLTNLR